MLDLHVSFAATVITYHSTEFLNIMLHEAVKRFPSLKKNEIFSAGFQNQLMHGKAILFVTQHKSSDKSCKQLIWVHWQPVLRVHLYT